MELMKRTYSEEEVAGIYDLARLHLENGKLREAEIIVTGLTEVAPDFVPAWLASAYLAAINKNLDSAIYAARQALRIDPEFAEATLFLTACLISSGDYHSAGTYLGEVGERVDGGSLDNPSVIRFYRAQLARYQNRQGG